MAFLRPAVFVRVSVVYALHAHTAKVSSVYTVKSVYIPEEELFLSRFVAAVFVRVSVVYTLHAHTAKVSSVYTVKSVYIPEEELFLSRFVAATNPHCFLEALPCTVSQCEGVYTLQMRMIMYPARHSHCC